MQGFVQYTPTKVVFGKETEQQVAKEIMEFGGSKVLIVYGGGSVVKSGLLDTVKTQLSKAGISYQEVGGVQPNPRLSLAEEGAKKGIAFGADFVLAIGGGSAIDTAKAIAHGVANPEYTIEDIWNKKITLTKSTPVGVILTIAAAGSETSDSAVLTNEKTGKKGGINTDFNRPKFAIMNPELTYTLPKYQIACGIVDIMMHTLERYFVKDLNNQLTDEIAEGLLRTVIANGMVAMENPTDYQAMSELMWCGSISHNGLTGLGGEKGFEVHKMGHVLGAKYDVAHGASLSTIWASWARYVYQTDASRFARYAHKVWGIQETDVESDALMGIQKTEDYFQSLEMPTSFATLGIKELSEGELKDLGNQATANRTITISMFRPLDADDVYQIYKMANK
ncbi:MAG: iron-containing alcohol dehydrogenase [Lachnospiraceae bacterium]